MLVPTTIHVVDKATNNPIEGVSISIWNADYSLSFGEGVTDANGDFVIGLEPALYSVFLLKTGYTFCSLPKSIGVGETPDVYDVIGTATPVPVIPLGLVWLYGEVKDLNLNPLPNVAVAIALAATPQKKNGALLDRSTMTIYTDGAGKWGTLLPGGALVTVTIISCKMMKSGTLPFEGPISINDLGIYG